MIAWSTVENALHAWVVAGSGLPAARVVWSGEPVARPTPPYITIKIAGVRKVGEDWRQTRDAPAPASAGEEIVHSVRGRRELSITLQCFDGDATGVNMPLALLERVKTSVRLPTIHAGLRAAGVGVAAFGNVTAIDTAQLGASRFEPRAILDLRAFVSSEVEEFTTYIQHAEVTREAPPPEITFTVSRED